MLACEIGERPRFAEGHIGEVSGIARGFQINVAAECAGWQEDDLTILPERCAIDGQQFLRCGWKWDDYQFGPFDGFT